MLTPSIRTRPEGVAALGGTGRIKVKKSMGSQPREFFRLSQNLGINFAKNCKKHRGFLWSLSLALIPSLNPTLSTPVCTEPCWETELFQYTIHDTQNYCSNKRMPVRHGNKAGCSCLTTTSPAVINNLCINILLIRTTAVTGWFICPVAPSTLEYCQEKACRNRDDRY